MVQVLNSLGLVSLAAAPGSPVAGQVYYDSVRKQVRVWDGTRWVDIPGLIAQTDPTIPGDVTIPAGWTAVGGSQPLVVPSGSVLKLEADSVLEMGTGAFAQHDHASPAAGDVLRPRVLQIGDSGGEPDVTIWRNALKSLIFDSAGTGANDGVLDNIQFRSKRIADLGNTLWDLGASAFPSNPTPQDLAYRSDLGMWFSWDGTRWLSSTLYHAPLPYSSTVIPIAATTTAAHQGGAPPLSGGSDIWIVTSTTRFDVVGGTALSASHKWVGVLINDLGTTLDTINIDSGASDTWRSNITTVSALNGAARVVWQVGWTKTGTPGTLYAMHILSYRIVAT